MANREENLQKARDRRSEISRTFDKLKSGDLDLATLIVDPPTELQNVDLFDVLCHGPGIRDAKARDICLCAQVWPLDTLAQLSQAERDRIADCIGKVTTQS